MTQKSKFYMTKLYVLARAHVLHCSRVLVIALRSLSRKRKINMSLVTPFFFPSRTDHFFRKLKLEMCTVPSDHFGIFIHYLYTLYPLLVFV